MVGKAGIGTTKIFELYAETQIKWLTIDICSDNYFKTAGIYITIKSGTSAKNDDACAKNAACILVETGFRVLKKMLMGLYLGPKILYLGL